MKQYSFIEEGWKSKHLATMSPQAVNRVRAAGMLPTAKQYAAGLNRGTSNLAKQAGIKLGTKMSVRKAHDLSKVMAIGNVGFKKGETTSYRFLPKNADHTAALTHPFRKSKNAFSGKLPIDIAQFKGNKDLLNATLRRHETDELGAFANLVSSKPKTRQYDKGINAALTSGVVQQAAAGGAMSSHFPGVLAKEKKITDITKNAYGTGVYRSPKEMSLDFNTSDPKKLKGIKKQFDMSHTLASKPKIRTAIRKQVETQRPKMVPEILNTLSAPGSLIWNNIR